MNKATGGNQASPEVSVTPSASAAQESSSHSPDQPLREQARQVALRSAAYPNAVERTPIDTAISATLSAVEAEARRRAENDSADSRVWGGDDHFGGKAAALNELADWCRQQRGGGTGGMTPVERRRAHLEAIRGHLEAIRAQLEERRAALCLKRYTLMSPEVSQTTVRNVLNGRDHCITTLVAVADLLNADVEIRIIPRS